MSSDDQTPCYGRSDLFDATDLASHRRARAICASCPVLAACRKNLKQAKADQIIAGYGPEGTWAGLLLKPQGKKGAV